MNAQDFHQSNPQPPPRRPRFIEICMEHGIDDTMLHAITDLFQVEYSVLTTMFVGDPVWRVDAEKVLAIISR